MTVMPLPVVREPEDARTKEIIEALDPGFLKLLSWDWDQRVVFFPIDHPVLGMPDCRVEGCGRGAFSSGLCYGCNARLRRSGTGQSVEDFIRTSKRTCRSIGQETCRVPGCGRPWSTRNGALCSAHLFQQQKSLKVTLEEFLRHSAVQPLPSFGGCEVKSCYRHRHSPTIAYCDAHHKRLRVAILEGRFDGDEEKWRLTCPAVAADREVSLRGLPERVVAELLYIVQVRTANGVKTRDFWLRPLGNRLRVLGTPSLEALPDLGEAGLSAQSRSMIRASLKFLRRLGASPETERLKDIWDLTVFGHTGSLDFTPIHQAALREAMKIWAYDDLPRRRGKGVRGILQARVAAMVMLSESLRLQREDGGHNLALLSRTDIVNFCNRLAFLAENSKISARARLHTIRNARQILVRLRSLGLTRQGQALEGLPPDFTISSEDIPDEPEDTEAGKDLPDEVMRQLCDNLDLLERASSRETRVATELLIDTGRRPDEVCQLKWDCLARDPDGSLILLYDNHKAYRLGRRLPIGKETAAVIINQQERIRQRFPDTPVGELALLPSSRANPDGTKAIRGISDAHRAWVDAQPDFLIPIVVEVNGQPVTKTVPFDKSKIFAYAYRHSYAQRHADAGVLPDVLKDLMDHRQLSTTQAYYRVSQERRREAVDRVTALQFDRHGNRVWRKAQGLMDSEHVRRAIGEVATAYGVCKEPSNVAAGGQSCPLRFRCLGCEHFNTDVSYLPDLEAYLSDLLRSRERLRSAFEADDWARSEAMPSEDEIRKVRRLISRVKADLDDLSAEERTQIEQAISVVRRTRTVMLGMPRVGQPLPDVRPRRSA
ncbi:site-specific integrase [Streptomyces sp. NBC_01579]|uniref:tyrosine-type recombinase/integrase n=1 Tax=Streptomyces sp. NBC_01579 TaxID=2975885 RepID=UPI002F90FE24